MSKRKPFPELEELIEHLTSPAMMAEKKKLENKIMDIVWEHRFWESING